MTYDHLDILDSIPVKGDSNREEMGRVPLMNVHIGSLYHFLYLIHSFTGVAQQCSTTYNILMDSTIIVNISLPNICLQCIDDNGNPVVNDVAWICSSNSLCTNTLIELGNGDGRALFPNISHFIQGHGGHHDIEIECLALPSFIRTAKVLSNGKYTMFCHVFDSQHL